jgi:hypothetical protein
VSPSIAPAAGSHAAPRVSISSVHALPHNVAARGLEVSLRHVPQNPLLQGKFSHQSLQPAVLLLQFLQPFRLVELQPAKFLPPPLVGLFTDAYLPGRLGRSLAVGYLDFNLPQQIHNLIRLVPLPGHDRSSSTEFSLSSLGTKNPDQVILTAVQAELPRRCRPHARPSATLAASPTGRFQPMSNREGPIGVCGTEKLGRCNIQPLPGIGLSSILTSHPQ